MSREIETLLAEDGDRYHFDFALGGINVDAERPVSDRARTYLQRLWRSVEETTGTQFAAQVPTGFIYNSTPACRAVHAMRELRGAPPFGYLHALQQAFFQHGHDIGASDLLAGMASDFGVARADFVAACESPAVEARLRREFAESRRYGTNALPSVLVDGGDGPRLLAGGYVSAAVLRETLATC